jgi:hypothetical protein
VYCSLNMCFQQQHSLSAPVRLKQA